MKLQSRCRRRWRPHSARVDVLKGGECVRAWINRSGTHYIINFTVLGEARP